MGRGFRRDGGQHAEFINLQSDIVRPTRSKQDTWSKICRHNNVPERGKAKPAHLCAGYCQTFDQFVYTYTYA
ncbi:hypothetical protein TUM17576_30210 [Enterobacter hormaechei]|nr:hypothetical protein TUM17576_30210 [Enterobacter hormaechei]